MKHIITLIFTILVCQQGLSQEVLFANYFDIKTQQPAGTLVIGKIHLKSNKDVLKKALPKDYYFEIENHTVSLFQTETKWDKKGRIFGVLRVAKGKKTSNKPSDILLNVSLKKGAKTIVSKSIVVHVVIKTMWEELRDAYAPVTISTSRLYGRKKLSDKKVLKLLQDLENNDGKFSFSSMYGKHPSEYKSHIELMHDWEDVSKAIGGLGYSYATSKKLGLLSGNSVNKERLKRAIYKSVIQFTNNIPVYGDDILVNGKPIGDEIGDGFSMLHEHDLAAHNLLTHQWRTVDGLAAPLVHVWQEVLIDIENGDKEAQLLYDSVIRYYQLFFSVVPGRRVMDDITQRWKNISDANYSEGAWADANIGHRMRSLMVMPILWADYNRPITYVPYWYDDYYSGSKFDGISFADNWSPNGVVSDVRSWCDKLSLPSHMFNQSGFHPDGTVTHHAGHGASDLAMVAYGFEWLTTVNTAIDYFKNTPLPLKDQNYQFISDRLNYTYRRMVYKNTIDYVVAGRSFFADLSHFGTKHINKNIKKILKGKSPTTVIKGENELIQLKKDIANGSHAHSETTAFWVGDYLIHRKEEGNENYFFSVKHKSLRTTGAEDFSKVRKSWHAGSGVFQLKVDGNEYSKDVLSNYDWHVLPGVTEEWRNDAMPIGRASASMPGGNEFSGILSDGTFGLTGYHHKPLDAYTSTEALKSYHLVGRFGTAIGSDIKRKNASTTSNEIVTTIDQSKQIDVITYAINGDKKSIEIGESVDLNLQLTGPTWVHHHTKGYLIFPKKNQNLLIKTGAEINITATDLTIDKSSNYILALDHGVDPVVGEKDGYHYVLVANASKKEMPKLLKSYANNNKVNTQKGRYHAFSDKKNKLNQVVFYKPARAEFDSECWIEVDKPSLVMLKDEGTSVILSVTDPLHSLENKEITIKTSLKLKEGIYKYTFPGIKVRAGEEATVINNENGSTIIISLPDASDGEYYDYKEKLYAGAPIVLNIKKLN